MSSQPRVAAEGSAPRSVRDHIEHHRTVATGAGPDVGGPITSAAGIRNGRGAEPNPALRPSNFKPGCYRWFCVKSSASVEVVAVLPRAVRVYTRPPVSDTVVLVIRFVLDPV